MYRRKPQGWLKHIDFLLLDLGALLLSFALSCFTWYGLASAWVFSYYLGFFAFYFLAVVLLHIVNNTFSGVLRRGYYREFAHTVKHAAFVELLAVAYLYVSQQGINTSKIVIVLVAAYYTYTLDLSRLLVDMAETEKYGYYHATNEGGYISWYDFACEIFRQAGYTTNVVPVTTAEYGLSKATRPFNSRLDKTKLLENGFEPLPTWQDALKRYLKEIEE